MNINKTNNIQKIYYKNREFLLKLKTINIDNKNNNKISNNNDNHFNNGDVSNRIDSDNNKNDNQSKDLIVKNNYNYIVSLKIYKFVFYYFEFRVWLETN